MPTEYFLDCSLLLFLNFMNDRLRIYPEFSLFINSSDSAKLFI
jgi:hypothetical protein